MKAEPAPIRLADYRPPEFLIDTVALDFRLAPEKTRVRARLTIRPQPGAGRTLELAGDELRLLGLSLDDETLSPDRYDAVPEKLVILDVPARPFTLDIVTELDPTANTKLMGLYRSSGHLLHAVRGGRLSPHHLFPRPAGRAGRLHDADRGGEEPGADPARQWQPHGGRRRPRHRPPLRRLARSVPQAVLSVCHGRRRSRHGGRRIHHHVRPRKSRSAFIASMARKRAAPMRWSR